MNSYLTPSRALLSANYQPRRSSPMKPSLSLRCPDQRVDNGEATELAMAIAEEVARLTDSLSPIGVDVPFIHSGLDPKAVAQLHSWLLSAYDYDVQTSRLLNEKVTPQVLAADILSTNKSIQRESPLPRGGSGSFASSRLARSRPTLRGPRALLTVDINSETVDEPTPSAAVRKQVAADVGMTAYESWVGKKNGLVYGLLAIGLVGSPSASSFGSPVVPQSLANMKSPTPAAMAGVKSIKPLEDPRAVMQSRTPIFTSFMDSVRFPDLEALQSPWVPDHHYASMDAVLLSFPQSAHPSREF